MDDVSRLQAGPFSIAHRFGTESSPHVDVDDSGYKASGVPSTHNLLWSPSILASHTRSPVRVCLGSSMNQVPSRISTPPPPTKSGTCPHRTGHTISGWTGSPTSPLKESRGSRWIIRLACRSWPESRGRNVAKPCGREWSGLRKRFSGSTKGAGGFSTV